MSLPALAPVVPLLSPVPRIDPSQRCVQVHLNLTRACNLRCTHCYITNVVKAHTDAMSEEDAIRTLRDFSEYYADFPDLWLDVTFIGGEPTLLGQGWFDRVMPQAHALARDGPVPMRFSLATNLLSRDAEAIAGWFHVIATSWDPTTRFISHSGAPKPALERVWSQRTQRLVDAGATVSVTATVTRPLIAMGVEPVLERLQSLSLSSVSFGFFIPAGEGGANASDLLPEAIDHSRFLIEAGEWWLQSDRKMDISPVASSLDAWRSGRDSLGTICPMINGSLAVDTDGSAHPCFEAGSGDHPVDQLPNVFRDSVAHALRHPVTLKARLEAGLGHPGCRDCEFRLRCRSGCGVLAQRWAPENDLECPGFRTFHRWARDHAALA